MTDVYRLNKVRLLMISKFMDGIIGSWFGVWYVKVFLSHINTSAVIDKSILTNITALVFTLIFVKWIGKPSFKLYIWIRVVANSLLIVFFIFPLDVAVVIYAPVGMVCVSVDKIVERYIHNSNCSLENRPVLDSYIFISMTAGLLLGGFICHYFLAKGLDPVWSLICIGWIFDLNMCFVWTCVYRKWLSY